MAAGIAPIFPKAPYTGIATLTAATALATRTNIVGTTGLIKLTDTSTDGTRIDGIRVKSKATSVASILSVWYYDGTTSFLWDEIDIAATVAGTTADSSLVTRAYSALNLPATHQLYVSQTVQTDVTVFAHGGVY